MPRDEWEQQDSLLQSSMLAQQVPLGEEPS
jgi:hypothetical protein